MVGIRGMFEIAVQDAARKAKKLYPNDKQASGVIKEFKKFSRVVLDRHLSENGLQFELTQCYPILEREIYLIWREIISKMLPSSRPKKSPFIIKLRRNMPIEIFNMMYVFIKENCLQPNEKKTQSTITVCLLSQEDLRVLFSEGRRSKKTKKASWRAAVKTYFYGIWEEKDTLNFAVDPIIHLRLGFHTPNSVSL